MGMMHNTQSDTGPGVGLTEFLKTRVLIENHPNLTDAELEPIVWEAFRDVCIAAEFRTKRTVRQLIGILRARINQCGGTGVPRVRPLDWKPSTET
jgi:hypothetical protein